MNGQVVVWDPGPGLGLIQPQAGGGLLGFSRTEACEALQAALDASPPPPPVPVVFQVQEGAVTAVCF